MSDKFVLDTLKTSFEMEISNNVKCNEEEIIITLKDGTKAKVKARKLA